MRISNIDTLSALFDRLICEHIKMFFFRKDEHSAKVEHQEKVIYEIKSRLTEAFQDILDGTYNYIGEKRTFDEKAIVEELEDLIKNDINIGESDRARLEQVQSDRPDLETMVRNEKRLRKANEGRAANKNRIDEVAGSTEHEDRTERPTYQPS
jgi:hypothetical protein